jgi:hypothetical protein
MWAFIGLLSLIGSIVFVILGIVSKVRKKENVKKIFLISGVTFIVFVVALIASPDSNETTEANKPVASTTSSIEAIDTKADDEAKKKAEADKKAEDEVKKKADAEAKAKEEAEAEARAKAEAEKAAAEAKVATLEATKNPEWNKSEIDVMKNGNFPLAVSMLEAIGDEPVTSVQAKPGSVFKAPWNYYGKPISFTAYVVIVQDYPPDSDNAKVGILSEIVATTEDGTILDVFSTVASGDIQVDDQITIVAYPIGHVTVENKLGGQTDQLALVTNKL